MVNCSKSVDCPDLVNKGTLGGKMSKFNSENSELNDENSKLRNENKRKLFNRWRSDKVSFLKRKNLVLSEDIRFFIKSNNIKEERKKLLWNLDKNINTCASYSLYRKNLESNDYEYIGSHTCSSKNCNICNYLNQKRIRRKYLLFFDNNEYLYLIKNKKGKQRAVTSSIFEALKVKKKDWELLKKVNYDIMHLTLTVPHYKDTGFRGNKYYYKEMIKMFNELRREDGWNQRVYGGEYGIETTHKENGLNIHFHSLLFVKKEMQNRNKLHRYILKAWNNLTIDENSKRDVFNYYTRESILRSNKLLNNDFIKELNPKGATMISLDTIFNWINSERRRIKEFNSKEMLKAVMEAISYHFEPQAFDKENGEIDIELLSELLPVIRGMPMYRKFGCLHGEKSLNIKGNDRDQLIEDYEDANKIKVDMETGEVFDKYDYFVLNSLYVFHDISDNLKIVISREGMRKKINLDVFSTVEALDEMLSISLASIGVRKKE